MQRARRAQAELRHKLCELRIELVEAQPTIPEAKLSPLIH
jgi:hypothetical protein